MSNRAWVTLVTNDSYGLGALVLAHSIVRAGSTYPSVVLVTPNVTDPMRDRLREVFADVITVDVLDSRDAAHLALLQRPELGITFTKIHCWSLTQYEKCVFLDADTLVLQNCDELFEREELSAAPDVGWPDCFNSGVFVFRPSQETFDALIKFAQERGSFDGGDQGLLNSFFSDWAHGDINKHLPFLYNVTSAAFYSYLPAFKQFGENMKIIHFIGPAKPWLQQYNWDTNTVDAPDHIKTSLQQWWEIFRSSVHRQLDSAMAEDKNQEEVHFELNLPLIEDIEPQNEPIYEPETDPSSEFPWHRPETVNVEDQIVSVDTSQYHDPWQYYRGNVPLPESNNPSHENVHSVRHHVWEYEKQRDSDNYQQKSYENPAYHHHQHHQWDSNIQDSQQYHHHDEWQNHGNNNNNHHHDNWNQHENNNHQEWHHHKNDHHQGWQGHDNNQHYSHSVPDTIESHSLNHSTHANNYHRPDINHSMVHHHNEQNQTQSFHNESKNNHYNINQQNNQNHSHNTNISDVNIKQNKHSPKPKRKARHRHIHIHHWKKCLLNGHGHESDSDSDSETVIPRHPYDGFYLLHQVTVDSHGRKMCTHEMLLRQASKTQKKTIEEKIESIDTKTNGDDENGIDIALTDLAL